MLPAIVRLGRRPRGVPHTLSVTVRLTIKGSALDWDAIASRQEITGQVIATIQGELPDIHQRIDDKLRNLRWADQYGTSPA